MYPIEFMSCVSGLINTPGLIPMSSSKWKFPVLVRAGRVAFAAQRFILEATICKPAVVVLTSEFLQQVKFAYFFKFQRV